MRVRLAVMVACCMVGSALVAMAGDGRASAGTDEWPLFYVRATTSTNSVTTDIVRRDTSGGETSIYESHENSIYQLVASAATDRLAVGWRFVTSAKSTAYELAVMDYDGQDQRVLLRASAPLV